MGLINPVYSYGDTIAVSFTADRDMLPDPDTYADALRASFEALKAAVTKPGAKPPGKPMRTSRQEAGGETQTGAQARRQRRQMMAKKVKDAIDKGAKRAKDATDKAAKRAKDATDRAAKATKDATDRAASGAKSAADRSRGSARTSRKSGEKIAKQGNRGQHEDDRACRGQHP